MLSNPNSVHDLLQDEEFGQAAYTTAVLSCKLGAEDHRVWYSKTHQAITTLIHEALEVETWCGGSSESVTALGSLRCGPGT